jgi:hypothetical protein
MPNQNDKQEDEKIDKREFLKPVAWLGGRDLLANLKYFLLFAAFKGKLDPRDWMRAEVFPPKPLDENDKEYIQAFNSSFKNHTDEFWFDYLADSGDGMTAGYALAYLSMSDLEAKLPPAGVELSKPALAAGEIRSRLARENEAPASMVADYPELAATPLLKQQLRENKPHREIINAIEEETAGVVRLVGSDGSVTDGYTELPRGAFLFIGGDTCYHVADYAGLGLRFQKVFDWAFKDLKRAFNLTEEQAEQQYWTELKRRPIFAVPGNHDYYDMIDGFNRQFGRPITREVKFINLQGRNLDPQLRLSAFKRFQTASYVAIKLPFGWWFWGVDSELKRVDIRQQEYFKRSYSENLSASALDALRKEVLKRLTHEKKGIEPTEEEISYRYLRLEQTPWGDKWAMPRKLIVATSEPTTVEGRRAREDDKTPQAFCFLDLAQPFMYRERNGRPKETDKTFRCRLDISGDVHHYARYWGTPGENGEDDYASIVSGGGGASMSPTETDYDEVDDQVLYPGKDVSTRVIHSRLFQPWLVIRGGNVWLIGLIFAMIIYFGASLDRHVDFSNSVVAYVSNLFPLVSTVRVPNYIDLSSAAVSSAQAVKLALLLIVSVVALVLAGLYARWLFDRLTKTHDWAVDRKQNLRFIQTEKFKDLDARYGELLETIAYQAKPKFMLPVLKQIDLATLTIIPVLAGLLFWAFEMRASGGAGWIRALTFGALVVAAVVVAWLVMRHSKSEYNGFRNRTKGFDERDKVNGRQDNAVEKDVDEVSEYVVTPKLDYAPFWSLLVLAVSTFSLAGWEFWRPVPYGRLTPFANNTLLLISLVVAGTAAIVGIYYSKWLFEQSYRIKVNLYSSIPAMALSAISIGVLLGSIWSFGQQAGRSILADVLYLFVLLAFPAGCVLLAVFLGNHIPGFKRGMWFGLMGLWHGSLQLIVPVLLVWLGNAWAFVAAGLTVSTFVLGGTFIAKSRRFKGLINPLMLTTVWVIYGLWMILIPFIWQRSARELAVVTGPTLVFASFVTAGILAFSLLDFESRLSIPIFVFFAMGIPLVCWMINPRLGTGILAGLIGAVMSCVWLGWYFATALVFHGHANEAGSTARTEEYKHFIRFKLTKDTLTGYVIAVDFPQAPQQPSEWPTKGGHNLKPRLVDVFTLRCNDNEPTLWEAIEEGLKEGSAATTPG